MSDVVVVVAAVIRGRDGQVLLARRPIDKHQGGKWEFPGGKVEPSESSQAALVRELKEELGITPIVSRPLIQVLHHYPDKSVFLDVWEVVAYSGQPVGREGQAIEWVNVAQLHRYEFPAANLPILKAVRLPNTWLITPEPENADDFYECLEASLEAGVGGVILRVRTLSLEDSADLLAGVAEMCREAEVPLAWNGMREVPLPDGVTSHMTSSELVGMTLPPQDPWSVSCHSPEDLARAAALGAEFALLSPVKPTSSHPDATPLGWERFAEWVKPVTLPVYALGGMTAPDAMEARRHGGQGIAAISGLWSQCKGGV